MKRFRSLSAQEMALWRHVLRDVSPLAGRHFREEPPQAPAPAPSPPAAGPIVHVPAAVAPKPPGPAPLVPLERKIRRRLSRGAAVDASIDLHGMRQAEAHVALLRFVQQAHRSGARVVLVVTGKGGGDAAAIATEHERGVLRRLVPHWLAEPMMRPLVIGYEPASRGHGGAGALYVRIRRHRGEG